MKRFPNCYEIAAEETKGFGKLYSVVQRIGGTLERYGHRQYGFKAPRLWVTGSKEEILNAAHEYIINYEP